MELVYGIVENIEYKPLRIQAKLPDMGDILSPWAGVLCKRSQTAKDFDPPVKGEQVALLLCDDGETALCLGSVFNDVDNSPADEHRYVKEFDDGTRIEYDPQSSHLDVQAVGSLAITCQDNIDITAPYATIHNDVTIDGTATITKDAIIAGRSFNGHKHGGVTGGGSTTAPPV